MSRLLLLILVGCLPALSGYAQIYKTIDKDGNVVYSDSPRSDQAEELKLRELNTLPAQAVDRESDTGSQAANQPSNVNYQISIVSPREEVVIPPGQRDLAVAVSLNPGLQADHLLVYYLDEELIQETQATSIVIQDPPRGGRSLRVEVIDQRGETLARSEPRQVNIIRPIVKK